MQFNFLVFLTRDTMCKHGLCCRPVSVCLSVTLVDCIQMAEDIIKLICRPSSTGGGETGGGILCHHVHSLLLKCS